MNYWLMKSEPDVFSYDDLVAKGKAEWDGVRNHAAQGHMKAMRKGDLAIFYHSNIGVEAVGIMTIAEEAAPDSTDETGKWIAVHVAPKEKLAKPVTLKTMKADPALADMVMIRQSRLSVSPLTKAQFDHIVGLSRQ
ncbi:EVE domain-containing protein [Sphingobium sp. CCH11-B1]|jgi:predicted RNA-binding protein with PUA-like domain|uniref:EVE domain-containing protein n=1 Tax=Sphingobium sp. CCH11-B1 TaxID=1768781 RepID=UPI00082B2031|nr:EVE domain-containing protein [Sphingobium sp. CCH11-B1]MEA3389153.1 EVE domain-containing protein [Pseudomonadota bacterium]